MADKKVRLTIEVDIDEKALREYGLTAEEVAQHIVFVEDDVTDGFRLSTAIPGLNPTHDFFLSAGEVVSKEFVPEQSRDVGIKTLTEMVRVEIRRQLHEDPDFTVEKETEMRAFLHDDNRIFLLAYEAQRYLMKSTISPATAVRCAFVSSFECLLEEFRYEYTVSAVRAGEHEIQDVRFYDLQEGDMVFDSFDFRIHTIAKDAVPEKDSVVMTDFLCLGPDALDNGLKGSIHEVSCTIPLNDLVNSNGKAYFNPETGSIYNLHSPNLDRGSIFSFVRASGGALEFNGQKIPFHVDANGSYYVNIPDLPQISNEPGKPSLDAQIGAAKDRQAAKVMIQEPASKISER